MSFFNHNTAALVIIALALVMAGAFYWYEWRPAQIREECHKIAEADSDPFSYLNSKQTKQELIEGKYELCLHEKGLE